MADKIQHAYESTFGIPVTMDRTFDEICVDDYDALAIPGEMQPLTI